MHPASSVKLCSELMDDVKIFTYNSNSRQGALERSHLFLRYQMIDCTFYSMNMSSVLCWYIFNIHCQI